MLFRSKPLNAFLSECYSNTMLYKTLELFNLNLESQVWKSPNIPNNYDKELLYLENEFLYITINPRNGHLVKFYDSNYQDNVNLDEHASIGVFDNDEFRSFLNELLLINGYDLETMKSENDELKMKLCNLSDEENSSNASNLLFRAVYTQYIDSVETDGIISLKIYKSSGNILNYNDFRLEKPLDFMVNISSDEAKEIASIFLNNYGFKGLNEGYCGTQMVKRGNNFFGSQLLNQQTYRVWWVFFVNHMDNGINKAIQVYVDTSSGNIVGGNRTEVYMPTENNGTP